MFCGAFVVARAAVWRRDTLVEQPVELADVVGRAVAVAVALGARLARPPPPDDAVAVLVGRAVGIGGTGVEAEPALLPVVRALARGAPVSVVVGLAAVRVFADIDDAAGLAAVAEASVGVDLALVRGRHALVPVGARGTDFYT